MWHRAQLEGRGLIFTLLHSIVFPTVSTLLDLVHFWISCPWLWWTLHLVSSDRADPCTPPHGTSLFLNLWLPFLFSYNLFTMLRVNMAVCLLWCWNRLHEKPKGSSPLKNVCVLCSYIPPRWGKMKIIELTKPQRCSGSETRETNVAEGKRGFLSCFICLKMQISANKLTKPENNTFHGFSY